MKIKYEHLRDAVANWAVAESQRSVTLKITRAYFDLGLTNPPLQRVEFADGTVDYAALHNNKQNILQRWLHGDTPAARRKILDLTPAILEAMPMAMRAMLASGNSVEYLATQALREHQEAIAAALLNASPSDFERECDEAERAFKSFRQGVRALLH